MILKLSNLFGKEIFTVSGTKVGRVGDVAIDVETRRISDIFITNLDQEFQKRFGLEGKKGAVYPYNGIKSVQDIIVISDIRHRLTEEEPERERPAEEEPSQDVIEE